MNIDKKTLYILSTSIFAILFFALFLPIQNIKIVFAVITVFMVVITHFVVKKRSVPDMNKGQVSFLLLLVALLFIVLIYVMGIAFGFKKQIDHLSWYTLFRYILPMTMIIISIEFIRSILLQQKDKYVTILSYLIGVTIDLVIFTNLNIFINFDSFINTFGFVLLPSLTFNFLYCYMSQKFGSTPNIVFRLIYSLYPYFIPIIPDVPEVFETIIRFILPLVIFFFIKYLFNKEKKLAVKHKSNVISFVSLSIVLVFMISIVMLISNQFKYGMLVIGTGSMTGELNVGDAIVFEEYDDQLIEVGDIIVFSDDDILVIHRVTKIETIDNQLRYTTKGDANIQEDQGYRTKSDIVGVVKFKVLYIGYPSILVRKLFN